MDRAGRPGTVWGIFMDHAGRPGTVASIRVRSGRSGCHQPRPGSTELTEGEVEGLVRDISLESLEHVKEAVKVRKWVEAEKL